MIFSPSVEVDGEHLVFRPWLFRKRVRLDAIRRIESFKRDLGTHEQNYILLFLRDGRTFWLGELDPGFEAAEAKLRDSFTPFDPHWREALERWPSGTRRILWDQEQAEADSMRQHVRQRQRRGVGRGAPRARIR